MRNSLFSNSDFCPVSLRRNLNIHAAGVERGRLEPELAAGLHRHNMTLMVEVPAVDDDSGNNSDAMTLRLKQDVARAIKFWAERGVDGVSVVGVEGFGTDPWIVEDTGDWRVALDKYGTSDYDKILSTSYLLAHNIEQHVRAMPLSALF